MWYTTEVHNDTLPSDGDSVVASKIDLSVVPVTIEEAVREEGRRKTQKNTGSSG